MFWGLRIGSGSLSRRWNIPTGKTFESERNP